MLRPLSLALVVLVALAACGPTDNTSRLTVSEAPPPPPPNHPPIMPAPAPPTATTHPIVPGPPPPPAHPFFHRRVRPTNDVAPPPANAPTPVR